MTYDGCRIVPGVLENGRQRCTGVCVCVCMRDLLMKPLPVSFCSVGRKFPETCLPETVTQLYGRNKEASRPRLPARDAFQMLSW